MARPQNPEPDEKPEPGGVLACDPGTAAFGWSYFQPSNKRPIWGHLRLGKIGDDGGAVGAALMIFLDARISVFQPRGLAFERVYVPTPRKPRFVKGGSPFVFGATAIESAPSHIPMNAKVLERLYGLAMLIRTVSYQRQVPAIDVTTGEFCSYFLSRQPPRGRAAKKQANVDMCKVLGWTPVTQDEADALALGAFAEAKLFPEIRARMSRPAGPLFALDKPVTTTPT